MNWNSWSDFFHMGGYGLYVWGSYAVTFILVAGEILLLRARRQNALKQALRAVRYGKAEKDIDN
ncbi:MAG: heme exporter protein CcmD [Sulfurimicrobium sp.]|jgi:heme exporter protein D|nr:heme exporter protein CcmD [Sulfurimicrobium sp.]MDO9189794.1 heme exporter protein CcmD [Sulfurimicrobium sp.]MDP1703254.1 heme exporter protein CcmD [Sulfurimicrobium sp.]MDP2197001.1 heme exporter protein CcmD [Sulfurimicrobium sp.]MDP2961931.1 heme exporter protein CcmD [Sulfurimicrobium sp.]